MTELYALPDHEVVGALLPSLDMTPLREEDAVARIRASKGVVPLAVDHRYGGRIIWGDIGAYPFKEWQYIFTIQQLAKAGEIKAPFVSTMDVLLNDALFEDSIAPQGFIFHVSRCGSTLLGKSLARVDENLVVNQGAPLQRGFWAYLTDDWRRPLRRDSDAKKMFRNLVLAMTRPRLETYRRSFVKFISWNTLYIDFVMEAWPEVRSVFLYRDPVEVIASVKKATTAALVAKNTRQAGFLTGHNSGVSRNLSDVSYLAHCYAHYFQSALKVKSDDFKIVEYNDICISNLRNIVRDGFIYNANSVDLSRMKEQFRYYSKDDMNRKKFDSDIGEKKQSISEEEEEVITGICGDLIDDLRSSPHNLFVSAIFPV